MICDPIFYKNIDTTNGDLVEIRDIVEISQGGPNVGKLYVNNKPIEPKSWFGGPLLEIDNKVFLTKRIKKLFFNGFSLYQIDLNRKELKNMGVRGELIWLKRIEEEKLYYSTSLSEPKNENYLVLA